MWTPAKSRNEGIVFCHGWGGGTPYDDLLSMLADRGYTVLRFEQRGYGSSSGLADLSLEIVEKLKKPVLIVQGTADASVPHAHGKLLHQKLQSVAQHRSVEGGNHHLNNVDRTPILADIVGWFARQQ
jgi:pimeloyl-ACP methyl ester carboxylesterase